MSALAKGSARTALRSRPGERLSPPDGVVLPPDRMPLVAHGRLLKRWRYVGVWSASVSLAVCRIWVGPAYNEFWAIWDGATLHERSRLRRGPIDVEEGRVVVADRDVSVELALRDEDAFDALAFDDRAYTWTRKTLVHATGTIRVGAAAFDVDARGLVDDSAGYHPRHTHYRWTAGAGTDTLGRTVVWNLVEGMNDSATNSERTVWIDAQPHEVDPVCIEGPFDGVAGADGSRLTFHERALRETRTNLVLVRSHYRHPFGRFAGTLPGGVELREADGVMEDHDVFW